VSTCAHRYYSNLHIRWLKLMLGWNEQDLEKIGKIRRFLLGIFQFLQFATVRIYIKTKLLTKLTLLPIISLITRLASRNRVTPRTFQDHFKTVLRQFRFINAIAKLSEPLNQDRCCIDGCLTRTRGLWHKNLQLTG